MGRSLIWVQGDADTGWACSSCRWRCPVPTLLTGEEAKDAYDRLAAAKFRDHSCQSETRPPETKEADPSVPNFADRARKLIKAGFKPKDAIESVLQEIEFEHHNKPEVMEKARRDGEDLLLKIRKGLI